MEAACAAICEGYYYNWWQYVSKGILVTANTKAIAETTLKTKGKKDKL